MPATTDVRQRFLFPGTDIRGEILRLEGALAPALQGRGYPLAAADLLGESLAAVTLLSGTLKFEGRLTLQARGEGPVRLLVAEVNDRGAMRGLVRHDSLPDELEQPELAALLGQGMLAMTIQPERGHQYQGMVPLESAELAGCLEAYFRQSEQIPTRVRLACGHGRAAGLLLQRLPAQVASAEDNDRAWEHLTTLAATLTAEELLDLAPEKVLHRLFHETPPEVTRPQPLSFGCTCSRDRVRRTLVSLGRAELEAILAEQGQAEVTCEFCGSREVFEPPELRELMEEADPGE